MRCVRACVCVCVHTVVCVRWGVLFDGVRCVHMCVDMCVWENVCVYVGVCVDYAGRASSREHV